LDQPLFPARIDLDGIDKAVSPGDNFFKYANGTWLAKTAVPADRSSYGIWEMLEDLGDRRLADIIQHPPQPAAGDANVRKLSDYYSSFMDEGRIEQLGLQPLQAILKEIAAISDRHALAKFLGGTLRADVDVLNSTKLHTDNLFGLWIAQDLEHPQRYVPFLLQGGLGMPDRSYYLDQSPRMAEIRAKYATHVASMLTLLGVPDAAAKAARIVDLEHRIATVHASLQESEDVLKGNNRWPRREFNTRAPGLDWNVFFAAAQMPASQSDFIVWQPGAIAGTAALVGNQPLETWKDYLALHAIERRAAFLTKAVVAEHFAFHGTVVNGTPELRPRWKRAVSVTDAALGDAVGKIYVERYFPPAAQARVTQIVERLRVALRERIDHLDWMTPETKANAKAKLATFIVGVGYPERWRDYGTLRVVPGDAFGNAERAELAEYHYQLAKLGRLVDRTEWVMTPQTINAVNLPAMNGINLPAAILQPPFFSLESDAALNYGAIGSVIGHEMSHSFDDEGSTFDATGHLRNWWTADDLAHFKAAGVRLVQEFNAYHPFPDLAVNGKQTVNENIADVAGLAAAYDAYRSEVGAQTSKVSQGFTGTQRFFLAFAQSWRQKFREPALRTLILTDEHAPAEYRANTVRNVDAWYQAFGIHPGQALYLTPEARAQVW